MEEVIKNNTLSIVVGRRIPYWQNSCHTPQAVPVSGRDLLVPGPAHGGQHGEQDHDKEDEHPAEDPV